MKILLTGAAGFVGAHVLRHILQNTDWNVVCPVSFKHKGMPVRITSSVEIDQWHRVKVIRRDLATPLIPADTGPIDVVMNVASESHVDRSIDAPREFIDNNVQLMMSMLDFARYAKPKLFLQMSTDEVYGPAPVGYAHKEWDTILPSNPYSASKAAQEAICIAYWRTYGVPVVITNTMNIIGEMQDPEKFMPKVMQHVAQGKEMPIHTDEYDQPGSRFYLHARNLADAWVWLTRLYLDPRPVAGFVVDGRFFPDMVPSFADGNDRPDKWHIVGERELDNVEMAQLIADAMGKELLWKPVHFHQSRPGHDLRYALDGSKLADAGWKAPFSLEDSLRKTVQWTLAHPEWLS